MNILFIGHEDYLNGASRTLLSIIDYLRRDNNIYVLTAYQEGEFYTELSKRNINIIVKPFYRWCVVKKGTIAWIKCLLKWYLKHIWINNKTALEMANYITVNKIDIIHSNTSVINISAMIKSRCDVKHIWHLREFADLDFNMYPLVPRWYYYHYMNKYTDKFICISKAVKNYYSNLNEDKKIVVYNGIDSSYFIDRQIRNKSDTINFLIAGRISLAKGQGEAIQACEILINQGIDNFELYIAGTGTYKKEIPKVIKDKIHFLGPIDDMKSLRKKMHIELVCSKSEAFGRVTVEAMLGGLPVIGSNTGGTTELIKHGFTGYLYEFGNSKDLAKKMYHLIKNPDLIYKMGKNSQLYAQENFTVEKCVTAIKNIYSS